jgi:hypothetical protein
MSAQAGGIPRCATCRFWGDKPGAPADLRDCRHPALAHWYQWPFDDECALGNGDSSGFRTGAKFGCPHHEARE